MTLRIAMWSGPRNLSTAMMRSFGSRSDTFVSDEPFYACFLKTSGADHPMRDEVIVAMDCDWQSVMTALRGDPPDGSPIWYQKHMWHHMAGPIGYDDFDGFTHAFLIREPERMIASYLRKRDSAAFEEFGMDRQAEFFEREADRLGPGDAELGAGTARERRTLGAALVRRRRKKHRFRAARDRDRRAWRKGPAPRRALPPLLRAAGAISPQGRPRSFGS